MRYGYEILEDRYYSDYDYEDSLYERAFSEGYEYAQREFSNAERKALNKAIRAAKGYKKPSIDSVSHELTGGWSGPMSINQSINTKALNVSHGGAIRSAYARKLKPGSSSNYGGDIGYFEKFSHMYDYDHGRMDLPKHEGGNKDLLNWMKERRRLN